MTNPLHRWCALALLSFTSVVPAMAQTTPTTAPAEVQTMPPIIVTAEKRQERLEDVPQSISVVTSKQIQEANITNIQQASQTAPNVFIQEFTNRRLSFPFIRGVGSGRNSPAVTTVIDGVPQLSFATSNLEFADVDRVEFIRGPQGTLYGRNTLGGVINILSKTPSPTWTLSNTDTFGNYALQDYRASISGPIIADTLSFSIAGGFMSRNGYTNNDVTGHDLDSREGAFGHGQLLYTPSPDWEILFSVLGERDRDGDYALGDLASVRATPHHVSHDFEGYSDRNVAEPSLTLRYTGNKNIEFTSVSALQYWNSHDVTDLDTTPLDLIRRDNQEDQQAFTQELRIASPADHPTVIDKNVKLTWVGGVFFFTSDYTQQAFNEYRPTAPLLIPTIPFPFKQFNNADLTDTGVGIFGQETITFFDKLDLTLGLRYDYEQKDADLASSTDSPFLPKSSTSASNHFDQFTTRFALGYHWTPDLLTYVSAAQGFKAGGFNPTSPANKVAFAPESSWTYEIGVKKTFFNNRLTINADAFYIDWSNLQLDTPMLSTPGQFYIDNTGNASSSGIEVEAIATPINGWDLFAGWGITNAQFNAGSMSSGADVSGQTLPFAPDFTWNAGTQYTLKLDHDLFAFASAQAIGVGNYFYDPSNAASQPYYWLADFRAGFGGKYWRVSGWIRNAFDQNYVPLAFPFGLAGSGYVSEAGSPQTYGISLSLHY